MNTRGHTYLQLVTYRLVWTIAPLLAGLSLAAEARGGEGAAGGMEHPERRSSVGLVQAGLAKVDITPEEPIRLSGYGAREEESRGIGRRTWVRALALGRDAKGPALILSVEVVGIPEGLRNRVARRLADRTALTRSAVTVTATHTHAAPHLKGVLPFLFGEPLPPDHRKRVDAYTRRLEELLMEAARKALADRTPSRLSWGEGEVGFAVNRREIENGRWTGFGVNPDGPVEHDLPVLRIAGPDGETRGVLVSYACHATTLSGAYNRVHGDWPGAAAARIEEANPGAVALVAIGAGADANPQPRGKLDHVRRHGRVVAREVARVLESSLTPLSRAPATAFRRIRVPLAKVPTRKELKGRAREDGAEGLYARTVLDTLGPGEELPGSFSYPIQTWTFGEQLAMIFLAGEVATGYSVRLKRELDAERLWVTAYANAAPCYIATRAMIDQGGYEVEGSMAFYGKPSRLARAAEKRIITSVRRLVPNSYY